MAVTFPWPSFLSETLSSQILDLEVHAYTMDVHKPRLISFELAQLREAAEKYTYHDLGTHGAWPRLPWERNVSRTFEALLARSFTMKRR